MSLLGKDKPLLLSLNYFSDTAHILKLCLSYDKDTSFIFFYFFLFMYSFSAALLPLLVSFLSIECPSFYIFYVWKFFAASPSVH